MTRARDFLSGIAIFAAGIAAGAITGGRRIQGAADPKLAGDVKNLKTAVADLESRVAAEQSEKTDRLERVEARLDGHDAKLKEVPSTAEIVSAMEQLLSKTMTSLDQRMNSQATSIEVLKTTVTQTDSLLERVLESLDALQAAPQPSPASSGGAGDKEALARTVSALEDRIDGQSRDFAALKISLTQGEDALARTLAALEQKVGSQARSLDALKTTASQTDSLLERVLESLDSMQTFREPASLAGDTLLHGRA